MRLLARRIRHLPEEIDDLNKRIAEAVEVSTPALLEVRGVSAVCAGTTAPATTCNDV
ncbi:hypothetical protein OG373_39950 [Streptomyces avidinii]|uniref:hypothetical protein n=1 Tax=Streptomyces avidinii TaxID=1895 RepID=UPI003865F7D3|nr:hypothetical protein OG373_39950 [Streptomyces avidinii]